LPPMKASTASSDKQGLMGFGGEPSI